MHTRTKIVCTIGPAVNSYGKILELIAAGMNVARLNFSYGTHDQHLCTIDFLKRARKEMDIPLAIMLDTHGPKIRVGKLPADAVILKPGQRVKLVEKIKNKDEIPIEPVEVINAVSPGMKILFDDGYIVSKVIERSENKALIEIQNTGVLNFY